MFHKEGFQIILITFVLVAAISIGAEYAFTNLYIQKGTQVVAIGILVLVLQFFRNPKRDIVKNSELILSPADGKIVVINKVEENEFFKDKRIQVSIFLSPLDVHVNRYPVSGEIVYSKYHTGDYLVAWHPKSSLKNERTTVVINNKKFGEVLYRQIAGAVARRIVNYATTNTHIVQGEDSGFIKFGSRVDLFLPLESNIKVKLGDRVSGGISVIA